MLRRFLFNPSLLETRKMETKNIWNKVAWKYFELIVVTDTNYWPLNDLYYKSKHFYERSDTVGRSRVVTHVVTKSFRTKKEQRVRMRGTVSVTPTGWDPARHRFVRQMSVLPDPFRREDLHGLRVGVVFLLHDLRKTLNPPFTVGHWFSDHVSILRRDPIQDSLFHNRNFRKVKEREFLNWSLKSIFV